MAGGDELMGMGAAAGMVAAVAFMGAGTNVYDAFSAVMSSPWSTEKFTSDSEEARMAREYVRHATVISWVYALGGALIIARTGGGKMSLFPVAGAGIATVYMIWLYRRAIRRGLSGDGMKAE
jgi:hypothetical protein